MLQERFRWRILLTDDGTNIVRPATTGSYVQSNANRGSPGQAGCGGGNCRTHSRASFAGSDSGESLGNANGQTCDGDCAPPGSVGILPFSCVGREPTWAASQRSDTSLVITSAISGTCDRSSGRMSEPAKVSANQRRGNRALRIWLPISLVPEMGDPT